MLTTTLRMNLLGAVIAAPTLLLAGTTLAAPQLLEHREPISALGNLAPSSASLPTAISTIEAKTGGKVIFASRTPAVRLSMKRSSSRRIRSAWHGSILRLEFFPDSITTRFPTRASIGNISGI
jgi:hypothetical protein